MLNSTDLQQYEQSHSALRPDSETGSHACSFYARQRRHRRHAGHIFLMVLASKATSSPCDILNAILKPAQAIIRSGSLDLVGETAVA